MTAFVRTGDVQSEELDALSPINTYCSCGYRCFCSEAIYKGEIIKRAIKNSCPIVICCCCCLMCFTGKLETILSPKLQQRLAGDHREAKRNITTVLQHGFLFCAINDFYAENPHSQHLQIAKIDCFVTKHKP